MKHIVFKYKDELSKGEWKTQECIVESVEECKKIYGLGIDPTCEYEILSVKDTEPKPVETISLFDSVEERDKFLHTMMYVGYKNELMKYNNNVLGCSYFNKQWGKHYEDLVNDKDVEYIAVISDNREVGFFIVRSGESAKKLGVDYFIEDVYTMPDFRGQGIMKNFVEEFFENHLGRYGMDLIGENKNATKFWCSVIKDDEWEKFPRHWRDEKRFYFKKGE